MNNQSQMLKGMLEGCILMVIRQKETYGYEISQRLKESGFSEISEGTIYPLLLRLEKNGFIQASFRESPVGPKRKYFAITRAGEDEINRFLLDWQELSYAVSQLAKGGVQSDDENRADLKAR